MRKGEKMIKIQGTYNEAKVYTDELEETAAVQIEILCNQVQMAGSKIRIMPDVHAGKSYTVGITMTVSNCIVPHLAGVDIGCGMLMVRLEEKRLNLSALDSFIRANILCGRNVRELAHRLHGHIELEELRCYKKVDTRRAK